MPRTKIWDRYFADWEFSSHQWSYMIIDRDNLKLANFCVMLMDKVNYLS